jgi:hypothetical protein
MSGFGIFKRIAAPILMGQAACAGIYALPGTQAGWAMFAGFTAGLGTSLIMMPDDD